MGAIESAQKGDHVSVEVRILPKSAHARRTMIPMGRRVSNADSELFGRRFHL